MRTSFGVQLTPSMAQVAAQQSITSALLFHFFTLILIVIMMWGLGTYWEFW
jgi:hypothetical protein